ncbi:MAG TPA: GGDEF domain-containing protein [Planctomycetota bacterium]|nr:GGDEF domain-containing protein [Planctomycetota bacterium]
MSGGAFMSFLRVLSALGVAFKNGAHSFREYYRAEIDPLTRDPLTMAWNRRHFERRRENSTRYALLLIDIDNFKQINDTLGHSAGDVVLRAVGRALRTNTGDRVFRVGGEEFAVLLVGCSPEDAVKVAERLRRTVCELELLEDWPVTVSVGVSWTGPWIEKPEEHDGVYRKADRALYYAKWRGKNRVALFDDCPRIGEEGPRPATVLAKGHMTKRTPTQTLRPWDPKKKTP